MMGSKENKTSLSYYRRTIGHESSKVALWLQDQKKITQLQLQKFSLREIKMQLIWRRPRELHGKCNFSLEAEQQIASFFIHCPSLLYFTARKRSGEKRGQKSVLMQFWSPSVSNSSHMWREIARNFYAIFIPCFCCSCRQKRNAKNAMNNFKVRVIKQQWGIIKHQASPLSAPSIFRYQIDGNVLFVIAQIFSGNFFSIALFRYFFSPFGAWKCNALVGGRGFQIKNASQKLRRQGI